MLNERRRLREGAFGDVAAQVQSALAGYYSPDAGHDSRSSHFLIERVELLGGVKPRGLVHHTVGQRGEVVALL